MKDEIKDRLNLLIGEGIQADLEMQNSQLPKLEAVKLNDLKPAVTVIPEGSDAIELTKIDENATVQMSPYPLKAIIARVSIPYDQATKIAALDDEAAKAKLREIVLKMCAAVNSQHPKFYAIGALTGEVYGTLELPSCKGTYLIESAQPPFAYELRLYSNFCVVHPEAE